MHNPEYLIRTRDYIDSFRLPAIHVSRLAAVFTPPSEFGCEGTAGWGEFRLRCGQTEISFAGELPGWQVSFTGPMSDGDADRLVAALAEQVEAEVGHSTEWVRIA